MANFCRRQIVKKQHVYHFAIDLGFGNSRSITAWSTGRSAAGLSKATKAATHFAAETAFTGQAFSFAFWELGNGCDGRNDGENVEKLHVDPRDLYL